MTIYDTNIFKTKFNFFTQKDLKRDEKTKHAASYQCSQKAMDHILLTA